jgi:hypothetical protein
VTHLSDLSRILEAGHALAAEVRRLRAEAVTEAEYRIGEQQALEIELEHVTVARDVLVKQWEELKRWAYTPGTLTMKDVASFDQEIRMWESKR